MYKSTILTKETKNRRYVWPSQPNVSSVQARTCSSPDHAFGATLYDNAQEGFLRLFQVHTNHLCQRSEEMWVIIRQRGTSEGKVLRCGKSTGFNIQIVENLQVIRDKSSRTYNHPFDPLRGKLLQDL